MSHIALESLDDPRKKNAGSRYRRSITLAALLTGSMALGLLLVTGVSHHKTLLTIGDPAETSIALRPDYPVSSYLYERGVFKWLIGAVTNPIVGAAGAFIGLAQACTAVKDAYTGFGCVFAGIGAIAAVAAAWPSLDHAAGAFLFIAQQYNIQRNGKRDVPEIEHPEYYELKDRIFGPNYDFDSFITKDAELDSHRDMVRMNGGNDVPVFQWTSPDGLQFHHAFLYNPADGTSMHRFGYLGNSTLAKRQSDVSGGETEEKFTSGGIDLKDCNGGDSNSFSVNQQVRMQDEINCAVGAGSAKDSSSLGVTIWDVTDNHVISNLVMAPYTSSKASGLSSSSSCPSQTSPDYSCDENEVN